MSGISTAGSDFAAFEAQFDSSVSAERTHARLRLKGWAVASLVSLGLWGAIAAGAVAAIHGF